MSDPETTVLLVRRDRGLKEDPYLAFLRTVPELTGDWSVAAGATAAFAQMVEAIRDCVFAAAEASPGNLAKIRTLLLDLDEGRLTNAGAAARARDVAASLFRVRGVDHREDLETTHGEAIPDTHGVPTEVARAEFEAGWAAWRAERAEGRTSGELAYAPLDVLMNQLYDEGVDVEEAEAAVCDLFVRESLERLGE